MLGAVTWKRISILIFAVMPYNIDAGKTPAIEISQDMLEKCANLEIIVAKVCEALIDVDLEVKVQTVGFGDRLSSEGVCQLAAAEKAAASGTNVV